jgi:phage host-nuclease inhibitor protein Gam
MKVSALAIRTWEEAELAAQELAELNSQLELVKERLREFCERRHDAVGKARVLGPAVVGFRRVAPAVTVPAEALAWLRSFAGGRFVRLQPVPEKPALRRYLEQADEAVLAACRAQGIALVAGYEQFYLTLRRSEDV